MLLDAALNAAVPLAVYTFARRHGLDDVPALLWAGVFPTVIAVVGLLRARAVNPIAAIVLVGIVVSVLGALAGGGPKVLLIRESFVTGALGLLCLISLAFPRPLMFYFGRWFASRGDRRAAATFDAQWERPLFRRVNRLITVVWGFAFLGEFALRVVFVFTLPPAVVLVVSPLVLASITVATIAWTYRYIAAVRRRAAQRTP